MIKRPEYIHEGFGGQCKEVDIAPYVLVPGSEKRVETIAKKWDKSCKIAQHYEYLIYTGTLSNIPISACSTGIGGRSVSIAVDELAALGGKTFIRVGVTRGLQPNIKLGDLVIASGAVRMDKTSEHYVFIEYPAIADFEVTCALIAAAKKNNYRYHVGIAATASSFYLGEGKSGFKNYRHSAMEHIESELKVANVLDWDTETATLLVLCSLYDLRAGRINAVVVDPETEKYNPIGEEKAINTALDAIKILAAWDKKKKETNSRYILPDIVNNQKF